MITISLYEQVCNICYDLEKAGEEPSTENIRREMHQLSRDVDDSEWQLFFEYWKDRKNRFGAMKDFHEKTLPIVEGKVEATNKELIELLNRADKIISSLTFQLDAYIKVKEMLRDNCISMGGLSEFVPMNQAQINELNSALARKNIQA